MRNAGLAETQFGIKISEINVNNFRYADDTTLMVESEKQRQPLYLIVKHFHHFTIKPHITKQSVPILHCLYPRQPVICSLFLWI